jgi:ABC-type nitrate/sulfonate/bicarbonate transport system permease component
MSEDPGRSATTTVEPGATRVPATDEPRMVVGSGTPSEHTALSVLLWFPRRIVRSEPLLAVVVIVALWTLIHALGIFRDDYFPSIPEVWRAAREDWSRVLEAARSSLTAAFIGYVLGFVFGVPVGMVVGRFRWADRWFSGTIDFFRSIPAVAIIPLCLLIFADHVKVGIFVVAYACFFVTVINTTVGVRHVPETLESAVRTFSGTEFQVYWKVGVPSLLPFFLASLRQNVAVALIVIVVSDMVLALSGLGLYILQAQGRFQLERMYAAIVFISIVGYLGYRLLAFLEHRLFPWWSAEKEMIV